MNENPGGFGQTFGPVVVPGRVVPKSSWAPRYPNLVGPDPRAWITTVAPAVFFVALVTAAAPPSVAAWAPSYPSSLPARIAPIAPAWTGPIAPVVADAPLLSWAPRYPAILPTADPRAPRSGLTEALRVDPPLLSWAARYPAWIDRREVHAARVPFATGIPEARADVPVPLLSWHPEYPAWIDRLTFLPVWQRAWTSLVDVPPAHGEPVPPITTLPLGLSAVVTLPLSGDGLMPELAALRLYRGEPRTIVGAFADPPASIAGLSIHFLLKELDGAFATTILDKVMTHVTDTPVAGVPCVSVTLSRSEAQIAPDRCRFEVGLVDADLAVDGLLYTVGPCDVFSRPRY